MSDRLAYANLETLFSRYVTDFTSERKLLAHYTSMSNVEAIIRGNEIWFSNPLYMNDIEEYQFGMSLAKEAVRENNSISELRRSNPSFDGIWHYFRFLENFYEENYRRSIFVACFSSHGEDDDDGLLSMWRAYGGNGSGAALVFDTAKITIEPQSPLTICRVLYKNKEEREVILQHAISDWCRYVSGIRDSKAAESCIVKLFELLKIFALSHKHKGFEEEKEWRAIYFPERDGAKLLENFISYFSGGGGIEPKLKMPLKEIAGVSSDISLESVLSKIIIGPTSSSPLALDAFVHMLKILKRDELVERLRASKIPFRSRF